MNLRNKTRLVHANKHSYPPCPTPHDMSDEFVDTRELKALVKQLPKNDPLRVVIQDEADVLPRSTYLSKSQVWLRLV